VGANIVTDHQERSEGEGRRVLFRVWKDKGWKVEDEKSTPKKSTAPSSGSND
jgi:hypothetical protein